jgi:hypothetical protein
MTQIIKLKTWQDLWTTHAGPHYNVAGKKVFNKLDAIRETKKISIETNTHIWQIISWDCFHDQLKDCNFNLESEKTYQQLCINRARQLREKYSYIRLWYSGGPDSHTTLRSFHLAGVSLDEVVNICNSTWGYDQEPNVESLGLVKPNLFRIKNWFPNVKIKFLDYIHDANLKNFDGEDFKSKLDRKEIYGPLTRTMSDGFDLDNTMVDPYYAGNVCELVGEPKPNLVKKNGKWYAYVMDNQIDTCLLLPNLEMFHLSPDMPELFIKQCHMLKRAYQQQIMENSESHSMILNRDTIGKNKYLERYNEWDINSYSLRQQQFAKKFTPGGDTNTHYMMYKWAMGNPHYKKYHEQLREFLFKEIFDVYPEFFNTGEIFKNYVGMMSMFWCLDEHANCNTDQLWPLGFGTY